MAMDELDRPCRSHHAGKRSSWEAPAGGGQDQGSHAREGRRRQARLSCQAGPPDVSHSCRQGRQRWGGESPCRAWNWWRPGPGKPRQARPSMSAGASFFYPHYPNWEYGVKSGVLRGFLLRTYSHSSITCLIATKRFFLRSDSILISWSGYLKWTRSLGTQGSFFLLQSTRIITLYVEFILENHFLPTEN